MPEIEVANIGPVVEFEYDMKQPGLHELKGGHGAGKTTILRTVQLAAGEKPEVKPGKADGQKRGEATIAGKTLKISRTTREEGELEVEGMGDLDLSTLHNPGHKTAVTRDKYRIATLVRLAGGTATLDDFRAILGDDWADVVDEDLLPDDADPVEMSAKVKKQIDNVALDLEKFVAGVDAEAKALESTASKLIADAVEAGGTAGAVMSLGERHEAHEAAIEARQRLEAQQRDAERSHESSEQARERIEQARTEYDGPTAEAAEVASNAAHKAAAAARQTVTDLETQLTAARDNSTKADAEVDKKRAAFEAATHHEDTLSAWEETVNADSVAFVSKDEFAAATTAVDVAAASVAMKIAEDAAHVHRDDVEALEGKRKEAEKQAKKLRKAAAATSAVLSDAIATIPDCPLFVQTNDDGETRLVIDTDRGDAPEAFDELSDGERWKVIVPLCCGPDRLVVLPQAAYGELAPSTRQQIHDLAVERGAYILTAQVDDGELRGVPFGSE